jgi:hypothetical protein
MDESTKKAIAMNVGAAAIAGTAAAVTKHATTYHMARGQLAANVGSAVGAAAATGAGVGGSVAAGTAVVTAKVAAVTAGAVAAAPFVIGAAALGAIGYGLYKLFED